MQALIELIYNIIWSDALIYLCIFTGFYFSIKYKFPQIIYFKDMIRLIFHNNKSQKGITSYQAFSLALSGRVGTGNIAGVATAIGMGGPGAVFWMWLIAILGSSSAIIEATLAQMYKEEKDGQYRGGPAFYITKGLESKVFAWTFAIVTIVATGFLLPSIQSNSISVAIHSAFNISPYYVGIGIVLILAFIIIGGIQRISVVAKYVVPIMAGLYILMALIIIGLNIQEIPAVISLIFKSAFNLDASLGAVVGAAISWGVKRGVYSNEAGQGTAPHAAAAAEVGHPVEQGLVQGFSVYIDTLLVCTATAFMILFTGQYNVTNPNGGFIVQHLPGIESGPIFTQYAVSTVFPAIGSAFVAIALTFFAFTTIMANYYIAETNVSFIQSYKTAKLLKNLLRVAILISVFIGCVTTAKTAWTLGDIGGGLMAWLNLIAILLLRKKVDIVFKDYHILRKQNRNPKFDNSKYKIPNMDFWNKSSS